MSPANTCRDFFTGFFNASQKRPKMTLNTIAAGVIFHLKLLAYLIFYTLKALIPPGILPRKSIGGRKMLITGAGSGIGRLCALEFGKLGAHIVLWDINTAGNEETKKILESHSVKCDAYTVDLSEPDQIYKTAERVQHEVGPIDILFNNAGVVTGKKLFDSSDKLIKLTMDVNLHALFYTTKAFLPHMIEQDWGHIITLASVAGHQGVAGLVDYCASKFGAVGFNESIHNELLHIGSSVKTTCINPYYIDTGMFHGVKESNVNWLLPTLKSEYVTSRIVDAVLTDQAQLFIPRFLYFAKFLSGIVPTEVADLVCDHVGANHTMDTFVGRLPPTNENHVKTS